MYWEFTTGGMVRCQFKENVSWQRHAQQAPWRVEATRLKDPAMTKIVYWCVRDLNKSLNSFIYEWHFQRPSLLSKKMKTRDEAQTNAILVQGETVPQ